LEHPVKIKSTAVTIRIIVAIRFFICMYPFYLNFSL
jgi:hypothetical protein